MNDYDEMLQWNTRIVPQETYMNDLASLGLRLRDSSSNKPNERRSELRLASTDAFVAWFQSNTRVNAGDRVTNVNIQIVHRSELNDKQYAAAKKWLFEQVLAQI